MSTYILILLLTLTSFLNGVCAYAQNANLRTDIYASHSSLMSYKGYQQDLSATIYLEYDKYRFVPFIRGLLIKYHYQVPTALDFQDDTRTSAGIGFDYRIFDSLRFRFVLENIHNELSNTTYGQDSYGLIYNQYLELPGFELNNYAEAFYIPRVSSGSADTFVRVQALKSFDLFRNPESSHTIYPFVQGKTKANDEANFGLTGQSACVGVGYKFYATNVSQTNSFSAVLEGHSVFYQSRNFSGDWFQVVAAAQWLIF